MSDFLAQWKAQEAALEAADAAAKAAGTLIGRYITHPYADSHATYRITATSKTRATIEWVDIGDAWVLPAWGRKATIPLTKVRSILDQRDSRKAFFATTDNWWEQQTEGTIVHYSNGFGEYVRGKIVTHEGEKQMLPIALVGNWKSYDLVNRSADGSLRYGYHAGRVINGEPFRPNASNMVEFPGHKVRGDDPRTLPAIALTPPGVSEAEAKLAATMRLHQAVVAALAFEPVGDAVADEAAIQAALLAAKQLLNKE